MKNLLTFVGMLGCVLFSYSATAQNINIPDANFKNALVNWLCVDTDGDGSDDADADANNDGEISVSEAEAAIGLFVSTNGISSLEGIQHFTNLQYLDCYSNQLTSLDVSSCTNLQYLDCDNNPLTNLNVSGCTNLQRLYCIDNQLSSLDVSGCTNLQGLYCVISPLIGLDASGCTNLQILYCHSNQLTSLNVSSCTNLQELECSGNQLPSLNVSSCTNLQKLNCGGNQLPSLNVSSCTNLQELNCGVNQLTNLNVSMLTNLKSLACGRNQLSHLDVFALTNLRMLGCEENQLSSLDVSTLTNLENLYCHTNQLTSLDLSTLTNLKSLTCYDNQLSSLDVSTLTNLKSLTCYDNQLISLFIKNGRIETSNYTNAPFDFKDNPNLSYICADEDQLEVIQDSINAYGYTNCTVNTYCSFTPGGTFYSLEGQTTLDLNTTGCDPNDPIYPNLQFQITDGTTNGGTISNTTGNYSIPLQAGSYTITPQIENPTYFTVSPNSITLNLPQDTLDLTQNFCIIPNGTHHDVEVTIIPTTPTRPGFDATYQIAYKNKGNQVASDSITFTYQDDRMDFISASIAPNAQRTNVLQWNYTNLQPFETRTITVVLNINSPTENPAVNVGDILSFQAAIYPISGDEIPTDNSFNLRQIVVGSYDPNDKICLEGKEILPTQVGDYLHYLIRFENTGTYAAENIVVKDMIDVSKFDISTLQLTRASHDCFTRINGNKVEFIFENINLPFTEPDKHGYVAFKIKTKPNLVLGDAVTNQADIFFDYNLPITTNVASTQVVSFIATNNVGQNDFAISLQPNPTTNYLQFTTKVTLQKAEVYDNLGRLVQTSGINNNQLSIGSLASGVYFVKVLAKEGVSVQKVVKE